MTGGFFDFFDAVVVVVDVVVGAGEPVSPLNPIAAPKRSQSTRPVVTATTAFLNAAYDGFGVMSAQSTPDCHPFSPVSSASSKLKYAPTAGWQDASSRASVSCVAWSGASPVTEEVVRAA